MKSLKGDTNILEIFEEPLKRCPCCGTNAEYKEIKIPDGQCHYTVGQIKCMNKNCRLQTEPRSVDGWYGSTTTKEDIFNIWNKRLEVII